MTRRIIQNSADITLQEIYPFHPWRVGNAGGELTERFLISDERSLFTSAICWRSSRREVDQAGQKLAQERGKAFYVPESRKRITGTYRQSVQLVSDKYALVERSREFTLVPWRPVVEKELGKQVSGLVRGDGISWELGRQWGLGIGM